jgi:serine/threonine-protein kinase
MQVDPKSWPILSQLMDEWLDLKPERRASWLAGLEQGHANILPALRELLSQPSPGFLNNLPDIGEDTGGVHSVQASLAAGMLAGPYRLVRELGHGGMGVVWLAERADGSIKREVALKFPHFYLHSQTIADRFARERDILARLTDSRIARLYDAGVSAEGQPYLALEYVEGETITAYCDRLRLEVRARLKLFLEVLHAAQYAHANLVVHLDLKPSNILVTNSGCVRLLDFGIAKLLEEGAAEETELTRFGGRALTPDFASPEQITGGVITTATDVYSLGVLLYELLTGCRPYRFGRDAHADIAERISSTDAIRPSQAAGEESKAAARSASLKRLKASLRGDVDTIVLKAIHKEPLARYSTADAFAQDIERHLSGQPVLARPESGWYRAQKFVVRNTLAVSAAVAILLAIGAGTGVALCQAHRADLEGYGGDGLYADDFSGQVEMENNLVYRVSGNAITFSGPRAGPGQASNVKNNILAFARQSMLNAYDPYSFGTNPPLPMFFTASSNILYFDRAAADSFFLQGGCTYAGEGYMNYELWSSNIFWRTDGTFGTDAKAFHVQQGPSPTNICGNKGTWTKLHVRELAGAGRGRTKRGAKPRLQEPVLPGGRLLAAQRIARRRVCAVRCQPGRPHESDHQSTPSSRDVSDQDV